MILNIETSTRVCSVALSRGGLPLALKENGGGYAHSENLTLYIHETLCQARLQPGDLDAVAVSCGPGSYTGLRIGVSAAKGICYAVDKPLIGIKTLQALCLAFTENPRYMEKLSSSDAIILCPMIDARRMEVYSALYDLKNNEVREARAEVINEDSFSGTLKNAKVIFFGDGAGKCRKLLAHRKNAFFVDNICPSAKHMSSLAQKAFDEKQFADLAYFEPFYLKDFISGSAKNIRTA